MAATIYNISPTTGEARRSAPARTAALDRRLPRVIPITAGPRPAALLTIADRAAKLFGRSPA